MKEYLEYQQDNANKVHEAMMMPVILKLVTFEWGFR